MTPSKVRHPIKANFSKRPAPTPSTHNKGLSEVSRDTSVQNGNKSNKRAPYNILFILTDQERYLNDAMIPSDYKLEGRERLKSRGVSFSNHQIASAVCTSSRSVIYTGQHMPNTKLFDNLDFPWSYELDTDANNVATLGHLLTDAGYYTAYKGKWHLSDMGDLEETATPDRALTKIIESYGFHDYVGIGDVIGMVQGGWINDDLIAAQARRWLRVKGNPMQQQNQPWLLAVNLVNPHDVMFYNTDAADENIQDTPTPLIGLSRAPNTPLYQHQWCFRLPKSRKEPFDKAGRPAAHLQYQVSRDTQVGAFANEDVRWQRLLNYYYNCILDTDSKIVSLLDELDDLGLTDNTIIVLTSDHGELGGAHGLHGKGTTAYQEQNHVPLIISHPDYTSTQGQSCPALTSHLDIATTLLAWSSTGEIRGKKDDEGESTNANKNSDVQGSSQPINNNKDKKQRQHKLNGKDLTPLLALGDKADVNEIRDGSLFCFNMFAYLDSSLLTDVQTCLNNGGTTQSLNSQNLSIDFSKRGAIRSVFDGRYKYTRYFSPLQHNQPTSLAQIFELNDVELFDLQNDADEMVNLASHADKYKSLLLTMNAKLNTLIDEEINGADDGHYLPI